MTKTVKKLLLTFALLCTSLCFALFAACSPEESNGGGSDGTTTYNITAQYPNGNPLTGDSENDNYYVQLCSTTDGQCYASTITALNAQGKASITYTTGVYAVHLTPLPSGYTYDEDGYLTNTTDITITLVAEGPIVVDGGTAVIGQNTATVAAGTVVKYTFATEGVYTIKSETPKATLKIGDAEEVYGSEGTGFEAPFSVLADDSVEFYIGTTDNSAASVVFTITAVQPGEFANPQVITAEDDGSYTGEIGANKTMYFEVATDKFPTEYDVTVTGSVKVYNVDQTTGAEGSEIVLNANSFSISSGTIFAVKNDTPSPVNVTLSCELKKGSEANPYEMKFISSLDMYNYKYDDGEVDEYLNEIDFTNTDSVSFALKPDTAGYYVLSYAYTDIILSTTNGLFIENAAAEIGIYFDAAYLIAQTAKGAEYEGITFTFAKTAGGGTSYNFLVEKVTLDESKGFPIGGNGTEAHPYCVSIGGTYQLYVGESNLSAGVVFKQSEPKVQMETKKPYAVSCKNTSLSFWYNSNEYKSVLGDQGNTVATFTATAEGTFKVTYTTSEVIPAEFTVTAAPGSTEETAIAIDGSAVESTGAQITPPADSETYYYSFATSKEDGFYYVELSNPDAPVTVVGWKYDGVDQNSTKVVEMADMLALNCQPGQTMYLKIINNASSLDYPGLTITVKWSQTDPNPPVEYDGEPAEVGTVYTCNNPFGENYQWYFQPDWEGDFAFFALSGMYNFNSSSKSPASDPPYFYAQLSESDTATIECMDAGSFIIVEGGSSIPVLSEEEVRAELFDVYYFKAPEAGEYTLKASMGVMVDIYNYTQSSWTSAMGADTLTLTLTQNQIVIFSINNGGVSDKISIKSGGAEEVETTEITADSMTSVSVGTLYSFTASSDGDDEIAYAFIVTGGISDGDTYNAVLTFSKGSLKQGMTVIKLNKGEKYNFSCEYEGTVIITKVITGQVTPGEEAQLEANKVYAFEAEGMDSSSYSPSTYTADGNAYISDGTNGTPGQEKNSFESYFAQTLYVYSAEGGACTVTKS